MQKKTEERRERRPNAQRTAEMRARLIAAARAAFTENGFANTGTPEIVRRANVTRGALYHHFADKTDVFRAVALEEAAAVGAEIIAKVSADSGAGAALAAGTDAFLSAMVRPGRCQILLIDGPAVLGPEEMDAIDAGGGRTVLREGLRVACPDMDAATVEAYTLTLSAAYDRAALAIACGAPAQAYRDALMTLVRAAYAA